MSVASASGTAVTRFWDAAPKPSIFSYLKTTLLGADKETLAAPPTRLTATPVETPPPPDIATKWMLLPPSRISEFCEFLRLHFLTGKNATAATQPTYILDPATVAEDISSSRLRPIIVCDKRTHAIIGCISSLSIGRLRRNGDQPATAFNTRIIRDFCIHSSLRGRSGLGSYLLFAVWEDSRALGEDAVLFLKEGPPIGRAGPSVLSSSWMYRRMRDAEDVSRVQRVPWSALAAELTTFTRGRTDVIFNIPGKIPRNSVALIYRTYRGAVLASFSRANQAHPHDEKMICYETGWLEKGELLEAEKRDATLQLSAAAAAILGCLWVWMDCHREKSESPWIQDGQFHWYAFHWTPGFYGNVQLWLVF
jgi:hypothetical protein